MAGQPHTPTAIAAHAEGQEVNAELAMHLVRMIRPTRWSGDRERLALFVSALGRMLQAQPALRAMMTDAEYEEFAECQRRPTDGCCWPPRPTPQQPTAIVRLPLPAQTCCERLVQQAICEHPAALGPLCAPHTISLLQTEAQMGEGRVDLTFVAGGLLYVVELKAQRADHRVVGQIEKYGRAAGRRLHYGLYDDLRLWVIAPEFTADARVALGERGVRMAHLAAAVVC